MGSLHICGFEVPLRRGGVSRSTEALGAAGWSVTGTHLGGDLGIVERVQVTSPVIPQPMAEAIQTLCRTRAGNVWRAEDAGGDAARWSDNGLGTVTVAPNFSSAQAKFGGTWSFHQQFGGIGPVSIADVGGIYTVASWVHTGGAWRHEILRSDGAQWVDGVRSDGATLNIDVVAGVFRILEPSAAGNNYFDEIVHLAFPIWDSWGAQWPLDREFSALPFLELTGDILAGYKIVGARGTCDLSVTEPIKSDRYDYDGLGCSVSLQLSGPERLEDS